MAFAGATGAWAMDWFNRDLQIIETVLANEGLIAEALQAGSWL
jgi:hypothetical protein